MNFKFGTLSTTKATLDVNTTSLICIIVCGLINADQTP